MKRSCAVSVAFFIVLAATTGTASSQDWKQLGASEFPARVEAIGFGAGSIITDSKRVSWGRWSVSLNERSIARYGHIPGQYTRIWIDPMTCFNEISGERECFMTFILDSGRWHCAFAGNGVPQIDIVCPTELKLR